MKKKTVLSECYLFNKILNYTEQQFYDNIHDIRNPIKRLFKISKEPPSFSPVCEPACWSATVSQMQIRGM